MTEPRPTDAADPCADSPHEITSLAALRALYPSPGRSALVKETATLTTEYRAIVEASRFVVLATAGPEGLDCSPRGDRHAAVHVIDDRTLHLPDRRGNDRIDSLTNLLTDPRVALLFLVPGSGTTLRVQGRARIVADPEMLARYAVDGSPPRTVVVITVESVFFQCARAIARSELWNPERHVDPSSLPTAGRMLARTSDGAIDAARYDDEWPERARRTMW